ILLKPTGPDGTPGSKMWLTQVNVPAGNLSPLAYGSPTATNTAANVGPPFIHESFLDLAGIDVAKWRTERVMTAITQPTWWQQMLHGNKANDFNGQPATYRFQAEPSGITQPVANA